MHFNRNLIHPTWLPLVTAALAQIDPAYLHNLDTHPQWLPGPDKIFSAFSRPLDQTRYILYGESPYPRAASANGYAFWDAAVTDLWSATGLSTPVNRATSLRHIMKMLLLAQGDLDATDTSQTAIANVNKTGYVQTISELFGNFLDRGFLLLNASLVLSESKVDLEVAAWRPFQEHLLQALYLKNPTIELVLLGNLAKKIETLPISQKFKRLRAEHPYNISFVTNPIILDFFRPLELLKHHDQH